MLNSVIMVGRLLDKPEIKELENGKKVTNITLVIPRCYKNADGEYEKDFVDIVLYGFTADHTVEYCNKGDVIGIKGRAETIIIDGIKHTNLVAEKVTFLANSSKVKDE